jgi:glycerol uptake facilitator-like aquaporin
VTFWGYFLLIAFVVVGLSRADQRKATRLVVGLTVVAIVTAMGIYGGLN